VQSKDEYHGQVNGTRQDVAIMYVAFAFILIHYHQGGFELPTVTISMSESAYDVFREWNKGVRSNRVSAAILLWNAQVLDAKYNRGGEE